MAAFFDSTINQTDPLDKQRDRCIYTYGISQFKVLITVISTINWVFHWNFLSGLIIG